MADVARAAPGVGRGRALRRTRARIRVPIRPRGTALARAAAPRRGDAAYGRRRLRRAEGAFISAERAAARQAARRGTPIPEVAHRSWEAAGGADGAGCILLRELLRAIWLADRQVDTAFWLLRLEMFQTQGRRSEFESVARQFADTYRVPRPEFETPGVAPPVLGAAGELHAPAEIVENTDALCREIVCAAQRRAQVVVDCSDLRRVDVVSARSLRQLAASLEEHGKRLELREINAHVVALLEATDVSAVSTVVPRV